MTQEEFGLLAGVSSMAVSQWENERAAPRMGAIQRIADGLAISKGEIIDDDPAIDSVPVNAMFPSRNPKPSYAPLLGRVRVEGVQEPDIVDARISIPPEILSQHKNGYFLEVEGQCMSRVYPEGCYIFIDPEQQPQNGSIAVVSIDGADYVMRRMYSTGKTMILSPDSWDEDFEDIVITLSDDRDVSLIGTVVWFQSADEME